MDHNDITCSYMGLELGADDQSDPHLLVAEGTLLWQPILGLNRRKWPTPPSLIALACRSGWDDHNGDVKSPNKMAMIMHLHMEEIW